MIRRVIITLYSPPIVQYLERAPRPDLLANANTLNTRWGRGTRRAAHRRASVPTVAATVDSCQTGVPRINPAQSALAEEARSEPRAAGAAYPYAYVASGKCMGHGACDICQCMCISRCLNRSVVGSPYASHAYVTREVSLLRLFFILLCDLCGAKI